MNVCKKIGYTAAANGLHRLASTGNAVRSMLTSNPKEGCVLICDAFASSRVPDMCKVRPVVVLSPPARAKEDRVLYVVPLSTAAPRRVRKFHHRLNPKSLPLKLRNKDTWAKCDWACQVALNSLHPVRTGSFHCSSYTVLDEDLAAILKAVKSSPWGFRSLKIRGSSELTCVATTAKTTCSLRR